MKNIALVTLLLLMMPTICSGAEKADTVLVIKSESKLYLKKDGKTLKEYSVALGANPKEHKQKQGDERTPEGRYILDYKKEDSSFYKAIHISYPNTEDKKRAKELNVNPGGSIMIHGQKMALGGCRLFRNGSTGQVGCIAVTNSEMDEIWQAVDVGTPIEIKP